jgi:alkylation response protein AidB-like acyl-CoA dehydrogenase
MPELLEASPPGSAAPRSSAAQVEDEASEIVWAVRRFVERLPEATTRDRSGRLPAELLDEARALGLFGMAIPESHGGLGLSLGATASAVAEIARVDRALATAIGLHNGLGTRGLIEAGSPELRTRYLPAMAAGERIGSFCATEPGAGSDLSALRTTADPDGDELVVRGQKAYVTNAGMAGLFTVLVRTPEPGGGAGSALVVVPREASGLSLGAEEHKMGLKASSTRSVYFDDVRVPAGHQLGATGRGIADAHRALEWGRTLMSAGCLGTARAALERSLAHTTHRRQFRRSLRSFGSVKAHLAAMARSIFAIEAVLRTVGREEASGASIEATSAALKVLASELAFDACDRAVQVHGALGFVEDAGVAILQRDARVTRIFEGANDVLLVRLGSALVAGKGLGSQSRLGASEALAPLRARLAEQVGATQHTLGVTAIGHQRLVAALAWADILLFAAEACLANAREPLTTLAREAARELAVEANAALDRAVSSPTDERSDQAVLDSLGDDARALLCPR